MLDDHYGNPASLVFSCSHCGAASGAMCTGAVHPSVYRTTLRKDREKLLQMP